MPWWSRLSPLIKSFLLPALLLALLLLAEVTVAAVATIAEPTKALVDVADQGAPQFQVWGVKDGLSDEIWSTLGFDVDGFVWAGSASSLTRFDGYRWVPYPFPQARSLVRDMASDDDGTLWALFEGEGLARYDGRRWALRGAPAFHHRFSTSTTAAGDTTVEVGSDRGLLRLVDDAWIVDDAGHPAPSELVISTARTQTLLGEPREWRAVNQNDLWFRSLADPTAPGRWQRYAGNQFQRLSFTDMLATHDRGVEELWVSSYGGGVLRIRDDGVRVWRAASGELPTEAIYSAVATHTADGERSLWVASRAGLLRFRGDSVRVFDRRHGLPSAAVRGIKKQRTAEGIDVLWLATEGGIARAALSPSQWQTVSLLGERENGVFGLLIEPNGRGGERLWIGSSKDGLELLDRNQWRRFSAANGALPSSAVRNLWRLAGLDGGPWRIVSLLGEPLLRIDDEFAVSTMPTPWPVRVDEAATAALSRHFEGNTELWFGTLRSGAFRLTKAGWTAFEVEGGANGWAVTGFAAQTDARGRGWLWASSNRGIARFDGARFEWLPTTLKLPVDGYRSVVLLNEGERQVLWASSNRNGVVRLDVTEPQLPQRLADDGIPPPPDPTVYSVNRDSVGRVYVCSNNGVQQLTPLPQGGFSERVFRRRDGLVHDECNSNAQAIDAKDRYWVGTLGGLSVFDPNIAIAENATQAKPLHITRLSADSRNIDLVGAASPIVITAGSRDLRIEYALLTGLHEDASSYRTQLDGFEHEFSAWTSERSRSFTQLAAGAYRLRVQARDYAGTISPGTHLDFVIEPLWWQRPLLRASAAALLLLTAIGLVLLYNRRLRQRQRELASMVDARTAELNTANQRLTELSYLDPLTGLANRRRLTDVTAAALERARSQALPIGLIVLDVDHFKRYNDQHGHLAGDAALRAVARALESATREQDLVTRFGGEEFACLLLDADRATVICIAERMRVLVEALPPRTLGNDTDTITVSAGVVSRVPTANDTAATLLHDADTALYQAKRAGRNQVGEGGLE